jgi:RNA chaperone Hfq
METNLLDRMLDKYQQERAVVTVTLQNRVRVHGTVKAFDSYIVLMEGDSAGIVFRHAISSLEPRAAEAARPVQAQRQPATQPAPADRPVTNRPAPRPARTGERQRRPAPQQPQKMSAAADQNINTGMQEGLLKWMQGQKASNK